VNWLTNEDIYNKHLSVIAGLILERNQAETTHAYSTTQNIDEKLDKLAKQMPASWWELPSSKVVRRNDEDAAKFDRVLSQIWHYQLESLVHLPFMLRAATDRRYEYSRLSCLSACRALIHRWLFLRDQNAAPFVCRIYEFLAFTVAVTLLLGILQPTEDFKDRKQIQQEEEDRKLVDRVLDRFERLQTVAPNDLLTQSIEVIRTLQAIDLKVPSAEINLRLTIPHFGTISVARAPSSGKGNEANATDNAGTQAQTQTDPLSHPMQDLLAAQQRPVFPTTPHFSFTSSQFPPLTAGAMNDWPFKESDVVLFDGLLNTDLDGNWDF
jgi:hypothetical protein